MNQPFINPWPFTQKEKEVTDKTRLCRCINTYIPVAVDEALFKRIRFSKDPKSGTVITTINILLKKLHDELQSRGITDFTKLDQFEYFIANSVLRLPDELVGGTVSGVNGKAFASDDGGRTQGEGGGTTQAEVIDTKPQGRGNVKKRASKGKGTSPASGVV